MRTHYFILLSLLFLSLSSLVASDIVSDLTVIKKPNDAHVKDIANFAMAEHYKQYGEKLELKSIVKVTMTKFDVNEDEYDLRVMTLYGPFKKSIEAVVREKTSLFTSSFG
ncbi:unnamed protein product [Lupinus luteus]|uniref:Cystatin domain-containing protein n=1 Tax=Lupinus luteus TaxID=3873 RepID=A0AAV1VVR0_LUPLU